MKTEGGASLRYLSRPSCRCSVVWSLLGSIRESWVGAVEPECANLAFRRGSALRLKPAEAALRSALYAPADAGRTVFTLEG